MKLDLELNFKSKRTGDIKYDTSAELRELIERYYRFLQSRLQTFESVHAEDIIDTISFTSEATILIQRLLQLEYPEEIATLIWRRLKQGPASQQFLENALPFATEKRGGIG